MALKADPNTPQVAKKAAVIAEIKNKIESAEAAVLTEYRGMTVPQIAELRNALRPAGGEYKVYKNTLVRRAADEAGVGEQVNGLLTGPIAVAFVNGDAAAAAKALRDFAKTNPQLVIVGGLLGTRSLSLADVEALADLPPRDQLLSQIAGLFEAPMAQTASVLSALLRDTVGLVRALIDKQGGAPEPTAEVEAPAAEVEVAVDAAPADESLADDAPVDESGAQAEATDAGVAGTAETATDEIVADPGDAPSDSD